MKLNNRSLFQQSCYINGQWINTEETITVNNPATETLIGTVPSLGQEKILTAI